MQLFISTIQPFIELIGIDLVSDARKERIYSFVQATDRARCLVAGLLLRQVCGITNDSQLRFGENNKPYLKDDRLYFNISHSGNYVVLAVSDREIGVDIEKITTPDYSVAARCFTTTEREWMQKQRNDKAFFILWTAKESIMKGSGLGLSMLPESFCVLPIDSSPHYIDGRIWFLDWFTYENHIICGATSGKTNKIEWKTVSFQDLLKR